jgi:hypothetical protein
MAPDPFCLLAISFLFYKILLIYGYLLWLFSSVEVETVTTDQASHPCESSCLKAEKYIKYVGTSELDTSKHPCTQFVAGGAQVGRVEFMEMDIQELLPLPSTYQGCLQ